METVVTYNVEVRMSERQFAYWDALLSEARSAFNDCVSTLRAENTKLVIKDVHKAVYYPMREKYPSLPAQAVIKIERDAMASLRSMISNKHKDGRIPQRKSKAMHLDKRMYARFNSDGIDISSGVKGKLERVTFHMYDKVRDMFAKHIALDPLLFIRNGRAFLSIPFVVHSEPVAGETSVGVDLGVKRLFVTSNGFAYVDKQYLKQRRRMRYLKRCLQSKGTKSAKRHLRNVKRKERNISNDMCHRACNALLANTDAAHIVMEDLSKIKKNTSKNAYGAKRGKHNNMLSQVPFYKFRMMLEHKAQLAGRRVETVSPSYTSQTDCRSGMRDGKRLGCHYYCKDGVVFDADWNAAANIAMRGEHPFSITALPLCGRLVILNGRAESTVRTRNRG